jgi:predicted ATPase
LLVPSFRGCPVGRPGGVTSGECGEDAAVAPGFAGGRSLGSSGLLEFLRAKELLLVLDNCEHLLPQRRIC